MYKNKKMLLMGLGGFAKGSGVSAAGFLIGRCRELIITDLKSAKDLKNGIASLRSQYRKTTLRGSSASWRSDRSNLVKTKIIWRLGGHQKKDFAATDWVIKNPDVPMNSPFLKIAEERGIPIDNDITLFLREYGSREVIGVTGTRGKSTTASLIYEMVRRQYPAARLGGNIGESPLRFLFCHPARLFCHSEQSEESLAINVLKDPSVATLPQDDNKRNPVILELSSFQLHNLDTIKTSPHIAVWTNFYPDHLNKYPTLADYRKDKEKIFKYQKAGDVAILNWDDSTCHSRRAPCPLPLAYRQAGTGRQVPAGRYRQAGGSGNPDTLWFSIRQSVKNGAFIKHGQFVFTENGKETRVCPVSATKLLGEHSQANILAAICAARAYGIKWPAIRAAIREFKGVPDRLEIIERHPELVSVSHGEMPNQVRHDPLKQVTFVNDCTATSPEAAIAALKSFSAKKIILISGGNSKGSSLKELAAVIAARVRVLILVPGNANEELRRLIILNNKNVILNAMPAGRQEVKNLQSAVRRAMKFANSGDIILFSPGLTWLPRQNEFDRGEEFKKIVKNLKK